MRRRALCLLVGLAACGPDVPDGWEDAEPVDALTQSACEGSPYEDHDERVEGDLTASPVELSLKEGHFRCEQEVEAFHRRIGDWLEVLVQPVDMDPRIVAACDCLYDIDMEITVGGAPLVEATIYRRWDDLNEPNDPVAVGSITRR